VGDQAIERVVAAGARPVAQQVPGGIVTPADHLIGVIITQVSDEGVVLPDFGAVARQVVGVFVGRARRLCGPGQALQAVVGGGDGAGLRGQRLGDGGGALRRSITML
jgi:hypothetical protein